MTAKHAHSTAVATKAVIALAVIKRHPGRALAICVPVLAVSVFTGTTVASAGPEATLAVPLAAQTATPAPHVLNVGGDLTGTRAPANKRPHDIREPINIDGCDNDYGTDGQCVPWQIPASSPEAACAWLKANGFGPLKVYGTNRQHLPENAEGYVCAGAS
jgi:hypothetical protein